MFEDYGSAHKQDILYRDDIVPLKLNESWAGRRLLKALSHLPPCNLNSSLDLKFQKKQMLEREQKKMALIGGDSAQVSKSNVGNGKVRQMFDDRRRGVGIDRSHPLRPIVASSKIVQQSTVNKRLAGVANAANRTGFTNSSTVKSTPNRFKPNFSVSNGNINTFQNDFDQVDNIDNETFPKEFSSLSLNNTHAMGSYQINELDFENNNNVEDNGLDGTVIINRSPGSIKNGIKLNPVITKKSPTTGPVGRPTRTPSNSSRVSNLSNSTTSSIRSPSAKATLPTTENKSKKVLTSKTANVKPATFVLSVKPPPRISTPPPGMVSCQYCQRHFIEERLAKHEEICKKMMSKKRKIFDASKHRVKGTEAEKYLKKGKNFTPSVSKNVASATPTVQGSKNVVEKKSGWRKKHEEFIAAIRDAKKVQAYLAKGGKLSDLPPPPPSENPDYIQCPHCSRRFNAAAAERHIPKCANMKHNKPKPAIKRF